MRLTGTDLASAEGLSNDIKEFLRLSCAYRDFASQAGVTLIPFRDSKLPLFSSLPQAVRSKILADLDRCVRICHATRGQGYEMSDSPALIWAAFKELGLRPPSDLFGHIARRNIVEVHSFEGIQIFRNFNFYKYCSYSLEELYTVPWFRLFDRDERFTQHIIDLVTKIAKKEILGTVPTNMPSHVVREKYSPYQHEVRLNMKYIAPLFHHHTGEPGASVVIETITLLRRARTAQDYFPLERIPGVEEAPILVAKE